METYMNMMHPDDRQPLIDAFSVQFSGEVIYDKPAPFRLSRGNGQGDISVQSEVGKGSRFTIHLPLDMDIPESE